MALPAKVLSELLLRFKPQGNEGELRPQRPRETSVIRMPADEVEKRRCRVAQAGLDDCLNRTTRGSRWL